MYRKLMKPETSVRRLLILALTAAVFLVCCGKGQDQASGEEGKADSTAAADSSADSTAVADSAKAREAAVPVEISPVKRGDVHDYILQNATVDTEEGVDVHARVAGLVERLNVEEGDRAARGTVLCRLEDDDYRLARDKAKVNYDKQRADFLRLKDMHEKQLTSTQEFEDARFKLEQARIDRETAELNLERTRIAAPIDGVVTSRYIRQGELVDMTRPLFRIVDIKEKIVVVHIPEREIGRLRQGQQAYLSTDNLPDRRFEASVKRLAPAVDAETGTFKVTLGLTDPENTLRPGMFVSVHIVTETHRNALMIPKVALVYENGSPYAFFVEQDTLTRRVRLETGFSDEDHVEVLSSVAESDRVVVVGQNGLKDGARIRVVAGLLEEREHLAGRAATKENKI
ncbi:MAG: efflux RND transporter periplasmic adaptor subunit [Candidatus Glassbacteria bacterium]|nr:efflux RND transporter periplasmic adaptor subunit [Candidatus Glassbacteria bacterium]